MIWALVYFPERQLWHFSPEIHTRNSICLVLNKISCSIHRKHVTLTGYFSSMDPLFILLMLFRAVFERISLFYWNGVEVSRFQSS